ERRRKTIRNRELDAFLACIIASSVVCQSQRSARGFTERRVRRFRKQADAQHAEPLSTVEPQDAAGKASGIGIVQPRKSRDLREVDASALLRRKAEARAQ